MEMFLARQPIFDINQSTIAYELLFRNGNNPNFYTGINGDVSTADVIVNSFFDLHTQSILSGKKAFINFTANLIKRGIPKMLPPDVVVVEILEDMMIDKDLLDSIKELKKMGFTIALDDFDFKVYYLPLFELGDLIKIDFRTPKESIENTAFKCRMYGKQMLAEKVETYEEFEYAKSLGCTFAQGYYFSKPTFMTKKTVSPMYRSFIQLLAELNQPEPNIELIDDIISTDASLVAKVLRLVNSAYYSVGNEISTVRQAIVMIGLEPLKEWIYLIGMKNLQDDKPDELLRLSLMRAKYCQEICSRIPKVRQNSNEMYLMGLISLLPAFAGTDLVTALGELPISKIIKDGIIGKGGVYSDIFKLCFAYEVGDWNMVDVYAKNMELGIFDILDSYSKSAKYVQEFWENN